MSKALLVGAAIVGIGAAVAFWPKEKDPTNPPDWVRWQVQQAMNSADPTLLLQTADVLEAQGWPNQAANLRAYAAELGGE